MKALVCKQPGSFEYFEQPDPVPRPGELLVRVKQVGICGTDLHAFEGTQPFFEYPRILGHELCGEIIDDAGEDAFNTGDHVTILPYFNCGHCIACRNGQSNCCVNLQVFGVHIDGGMREYVSIPARFLVRENELEWESLALVEPLAIAAHGIGRAAIRPGEFVLIMGAGPIGLGLIGFAHRAGGRVIVMDVNESRLKFCAEHMPVEYCIHAPAEDPVTRLKGLTEGDMPTVVIDATGNIQAIQGGLEYLAHGGRYVLVGLQKKEFSFSHPAFHKRETTLMSSRNATLEDFHRVIGAIRKQEIDPKKFITHRVLFGDLGNQFPSWLNPAKGVIKALVEMA